MKNFLKNLGGKPDDGGGLVGKQMSIGPYQVKVEAKLAEGGYACIFKVRDLGKGQPFALKQLKVQGDAEALEEVKLEARVMHQLRGHPHILKLHAVALSGPKGSEDCLMLLDLCEFSLVDAARSKKLDRRTALEAFYHTCKAVAHMHAHNPPLTHRDLKPENLLRHPGGRWVLCDFGSSTSRAQVYQGDALLMEEENIRRFTTPAYRAPEMWDLHCRERIDTQSDIWALGCMLYWLTFAKLAFAGESKLAALNGNYQMPPAGGTEPIRRLIQEMLTVDPKVRPNIRGVLAKLAPILQAEGIQEAKASAALPSHQAATAPRPPVQPSQRQPTQPQQPQRPQSATQSGQQQQADTRPPPWTESATAVAAGALTGDSSGQQQTEQWFADFDSPSAQEAPPAPPPAPAPAPAEQMSSMGQTGGSSVQATTGGSVRSVPSSVGAAAEEPAEVRRQLAEALAANAALQRRVGQLEAMVRSQAATISALHAPGSRTPSPHRPGMGLSGYPSPAGGLDMTAETSASHAPDMSVHSTGSSQGPLAPGAAWAAFEELQAPNGSGDPFQ